MTIPFNRPFFTGLEPKHVSMAALQGKISGNGIFTRKCHAFFEQRYGFRKVLLTTSCTDALEMAAILCGIEAGDEVIMPSYTFVSTANAFILRGAKIVFADSETSNPNIDASLIESLITAKTRVIVVVHYAGIACDMGRIMEIANRHSLLVVEDAAHAVDSFYLDRPLGSIGHLAAFSFHETKNITCGEGGMLVINDERFLDRSEIIWEKGTNRAAFNRGEVDKYGWVDIGSSFLPSELTAAFLSGQIEMLDEIQLRRKAIFNSYQSALAHLEASGKIRLPFCPAYASQNGHLFYILTRNLDTRDRLISFLARKGIQAVFHYLSLHSSSYYSPKHDGRQLPNSDHFSSNLIRLPFFYNLQDQDIEKICEAIGIFYAG